MLVPSKHATTRLILVSEILFWACGRNCVVTTRTSAGKMIQQCLMFYNVQRRAARVKRDSFKTMKRVHKPRAGWCDGGAWFGSISEYSQGMLKVLKHLGSKAAHEVYCVSSAPRERLVVGDRPDRKEAMLVNSFNRCVRSNEWRQKRFMLDPFVVHHEKSLTKLWPMFWLIS